MAINQDMEMGMGIARSLEIYLILSAVEAGAAAGRPVHGVSSAVVCLILFRGRAVEVGLRVGSSHNSRTCKVIPALSAMLISFP